MADGNLGEIEVHRAADAHEVDRERTTRIVVDHVELPEIMAADSDRQPSREPEEADWFSAGDGDGEVEWPAFASPRRDRNGGEPRERQLGEASDRVRYLFPVPDSTDWDVGELRYERKKGR